MFSTTWRSLLLTSSLWTATCLADQPPYHGSAKYNEVEYGRYPHQKYHSIDLDRPPPVLNLMRPFSNCDDGSYIFVAPRGGVPKASFFILDHDGAMIWNPQQAYGQVYNFQVVQYKGEDYLMFWGGDDSIGGHGEGKYYLLDKHYEEHAEISAGDGIRGDLHAFSITKENTAVYTAYHVEPHDLSEVGRPKDSFIWESLFQELDIETGEVIFEWRASDHFPFADAYVNPNEATQNHPWDFFHINMVEKDDDGNYLVSTRYGRCVLYVDGKSGDILWRLGGKRNSFKDLSGGLATTFLGQHDAHWYKGHEYITMFDNRADWFNKIESQSRGKRIKVDLEKMTAELEVSYDHPTEILSTSQGNLQMLPNGNAFVGYGFNGAYTEFTADGEVLCDAYMMPSKRFGSGDVQSYRNLKFNWTGIPNTKPDVVFINDTIYMSWMGSTELRSWQLQDADSEDGLFESVQTTRREGFETEFNLRQGKRMRQFVRAIAVDEGGTQLSISNPVDLQDPEEIWGEKSQKELQEEEEHRQQHSHDNAHGNDGYQNLRKDLEDVQILLVLGILVVISAVVVAFMTFGCKRFRRITPRFAGGLEKDFSNGMARFRDDGKIRTTWNRIRSAIPGMGRKKSWREYSGSQRRGLLGGDGEAEGEDSMFEHSQLSVDDSESR